MKEDRPGWTSGVMLLIIFGSCSGSFVEDTLKKEKQGFSSSYATDTGLKSETNGRSFSLWKCNSSPSTSITTFPFQAHVLSLIMHKKTAKASFTAVKTGGLKSVPTRDKATYAGKWCNSDFHWKKHQSTIYKKAIILEWHEWSLCNDIRGRECLGVYSVCNEQTTCQRNWYQWYDCAWVGTWGIFLLLEKIR